MISRCVWLVGACVLLLGSIAVAQTVYTWRDDKGVVHFADENPEGVKNVEKLTLDVPAPLVSEGGEGGAPQGGEPGSGAPGETMVVTPAAPGAQAGGAPEAAPPPPSGPSEVVFLGADLSPTSATQRHVRGKLKNVGGNTALKVAVRIVVADGGTGNLCTTGELAVQPSELGPSESGTFEGDIDTPCFYGNPSISYYPEWD
jgi:hypothetical protein